MIIGARDSMPAAKQTVVQAYSTMNAERHNPPESTSEIRIERGKHSDNGFFLTIFADLTM